MHAPAAASFDDQLAATEVAACKAVEQSLPFRCMKHLLTQRGCRYGGPSAGNAWADTAVGRTARLTELVDAEEADRPSGQAAQSAKDMQSQADAMAESLLREEEATKVKARAQKDAKLQRRSRKAGKPSSNPKNSVLTTRQDLSSHPPNLAGDDAQPTQQQIVLGVTAEQQEAADQGHGRAASALPLRGSQGIEIPISSPRQMASSSQKSHPAAAAAADCQIHHKQPENHQNLCRPRSANNYDHVLPDAQSMTDCSHLAYQQLQLPHDRQCDQASNPSTAKIDGSALDPSAWQSASAASQICLGADRAEDLSQPANRSNESACMPLSQPAIQGRMRGPSARDSVKDEMSRADRSRRPGSQHAANVPCPEQQHSASVESAAGSSRRQPKTRRTPHASLDAVRVDQSLGMTNCSGKATVC